MIRKAAVFLLLGIGLAACSAEMAVDPAPSRPGPTIALETPPQPTTAPAPSPPPTTEPAPATEPAAKFAGAIGQIDGSRLPYSWRPGCPVHPEDLRLLTVSHWGFDGLVKTGELVVHRSEAGKLLGVFERMFELRFPIEKMKLIDNYRGDDDLSVAANNTSAFNCRAVTGRPGTWSQHSYGWAIDINPVQNPFISSGKVSPPAAESYRDRSQARPGMIRPNDEVVKAFLSIGWEWGGYWNNPMDYQHFSLTGR